MKLDHVAYRVAPQYFEVFVEMLKEKLGFIEVRRIEEFVWLRQPGANVDLQLGHSSILNRDADKDLSQIGFLSDTPLLDLEALMLWAQEHGMKMTIGSYSNKEYYLDAPDAFVDFVIEAMTPDMADYPL